MRKVLPRWIRLVMLVVLAGLLCAGGATWYTWQKRPTTVSQDTPVYRGEHNASTRYQVMLKPNDLYPTRALGPGLTYFSNLVDQIVVSCLYTFAGDGPAKVEGTHQLLGVVEAYEAARRPEEKPIKVWEKQFLLSPEKRFSCAGGPAPVRDEVAIDLSVFNGLVEGFIKQTEYRPSEFRLALRWEVTSRLEVAGESREETLTPVLWVPLGVNAFRIGGESDAKVPVSFVRTQQVTDPMVPLQRKRWSVVSLCLLVLFIGVALGTRSPAGHGDKEARTLAAIRKQYGNRIAAAAPAGSPACDNLVRLLTFEDLVKVADELGKPIISEIQPGTSRPVFYLVDGSTRYEYWFGYQPRVRHRRQPKECTAPGGES